MTNVFVEYEKTGTKAEKALIAACREGMALNLTGGKLPYRHDKDAHKVRASLIRLLALEQTSLHEAGVWLEGAVITGQLDLRFAKCRGTLTLKFCRFDERLEMGRAVLAELSVEGSQFPGLFAQDAKVTGPAFIRGAIVTGTVDLAGAQIGGQLTFRGARLNGCGGPALVAQGVRVTGSVVLRNVNATGLVGFNGADIGGQLELNNAKLNNSEGSALWAEDARVGAGVGLIEVDARGMVDLKGSQIGGQVELDRATLNGGGRRALGASSSRMEGGLYFRNLRAVTGPVDFASAKVGDLVDDVASWDKCSEIILDGFTYDRIAGNTAPRTFAGRKSWLEKGSWFEGEFLPHSYTQFAKVMRAAGHLAEARKALVARDTILFEVAEQSDRKALEKAYDVAGEANGDAGWIWLRLHGRRIWASLSRRIIGHGHHPHYALFWSLALWGLGATIYFIAFSAGLMVPNSDVIMVSSEWLAAVEANRLAPTGVWLGQGSLASAHYETFFASIYALDVFLPLVDLGQESAWTATTTRVWGTVLRYFTFAYQVAGWVVTSLGLAAVTGFVQRNAPD